MTSDESRMTFVENSTSATLCDTNVFGAERLESDVEATSFPGWLSCKPAHSPNLTQRILLKIKTTFLNQNINIMTDSTGTCPNITNIGTDLIDSDGRGQGGMKISTVLHASLSWIQSFQTNP